MVGKGIGEVLKGVGKLADAFARTTEQVLTALAPLIGLLPRHAPVEILTYRDAIEFFVEHRPPEPSIAKGAMLLMPSDQGFLLVEVFLNGNSELVLKPDGSPYGRRVAFRRLDSELMALFADKQLVIVE